MSTLADIATEFLEENPSVSTHGAAAILKRQHPLVFRDEEHARHVVRYVRGAAGHKNKGRRALRPHLERDAAQVAACLRITRLPEGMTTLRAWKPVELPAGKILSLSDLHVPFHCRESIEAAVKDGRRFAPDIVLLNGDIADFYSISQWQKDPRLRNFAAEIKVVLVLLEWLRAQFPKARIIFKEGNHDERWDSYVHRNAPDLAGVSDISLRRLLRLKEHGIEYVGDKRPIKAGKLYILHGHEWRKTFAPPVNPARGLFLRAKDCCLAGHWHQPSSHVENTVGHRLISCWTQACLCDLHPAYCPQNAWANGWARVEVDRGGGFEVHNRKLVSGANFPS